MRHHLTVSPVVAGVAAFGLLFAAGAQATMYRYTDENGRLVISNTIPQEATKRGYDILSNNGRVVETVAPAPTAEEIAARGLRDGSRRPSGFNAGGGYRHMAVSSRRR